MSIALICEGPTDQRFLEWLLGGIYGPDVVVNSTQPPRDETDRDRQGDSGGWENVFAFFDRPNALEEVFATNKFMIVQIDTDVCEHENFNVSMRNGDGEKAVAQLVGDVRDRLIEKMGRDSYQKYQERIFFAICVHSLECWILPLYARKNSDIAATLNCENRLYYALAAIGEKYVKDSKYYRVMTKIIRKEPERRKCYENSESLRIFIDSLGQLII